MGLTIPTTGMRVVNKTGADRSDITMNGMTMPTSHHADRRKNRWRVAEEPVEVPTPNTPNPRATVAQRFCNIIFDGFPRGRIAALNGFRVC